MKVVFDLSGTPLFEAEMDHAPQVGTKVLFKTITYKKGLPAGSLIEVTVGYLDEAPVYDFTSNEPILRITANGYEVIKRGPAPEED